ncbi:PTS sugar transporter subunit IIA [Tannockella kyphosi]|uniref:PTS sugar transporter subunit IIA n=1 Tax=Tannockella kyphosi TaxID=2899121 RepID=UPI002012174D|nr:PTS sugar transporter subunit IIA [Tannockella kyphosi]
MIKKELIYLDLEQDNKLEIIDFLADLANKEGKLNNIEEYKAAVLRREEEFSTALGFLVAMPHGQSDGVNEPFVIFARCKEEMTWDENQVKLIFMIGVPMANREATHMKILANISRKLIDENFRQSLLDAGDSEEVYQILSQITI